MQSSKKYRIVVRTWAEVIGEAEHRLKFVQASLKYESNRDQGLVSMRDKYSEYPPQEALDAATPGWIRGPAGKRLVQSVPRSGILAGCFFRRPYQPSLRRFLA